MTFATMQPRFIIIDHKALIDRVLTRFRTVCYNLPSLRRSASKTCNHATDASHEIKISHDDDGRVQKLPSLDVNGRRHNTTKYYNGICINKCL